MAIKGLEGFNKENPPFELDEFLVFTPNFKEFFDNQCNIVLFDTFKEISNSLVSYTHFGKAWKLAMSYAIAHFLTLHLKHTQALSTATASDLGSMGNGTGIITSYSVGGLSQSMDFGAVMSEAKEDKFWNNTEYGRLFVTLRDTIPSISMFVATPGVF